MAFYQQGFLQQRPPASSSTALHCRIVVICAAVRTFAVTVTLEQEGDLWLTGAWGLHLLSPWLSAHDLRPLSRARLVDCHAIASLPDVPSMPSPP